ncbi:WD40-repeat-containing domain protein [Scleroderma yunnanense]
MENKEICSGGESEQQTARVPNSLAFPHPSGPLSNSRHVAQDRWVTSENPKHFSFPAHGTSVVTCLLLSHERIISASDDHSIHVYSPATGELLLSLDGHEGGVWALAASKDTLVSGSTDRTVRIWDLSTGRCTHAFTGHTSTVRCLTVVRPEVVDIEGEGGVVTREKWPKRSLIVTGSRDHSLRVWTLPHKGDPEYRWSGADDADTELAEEDVKENPYHKLHLEGHDYAVRALAARGRMLISGSYDCTVRVWDIITGESDSTLRIWDPDSGELCHTLAAHAGAITCFQHDEFKVLSGSDGTLKMWNIREGTVARDLLTGVNGVWQVVFEGRYCVAASNRNNATMLDV